MLARALLPFYPACPERSRWALCLASRESSLSSIIPAHTRYLGEGGYTGFLVRPIRRALFSETPRRALFLFQALAHSFIFRSTSIPCLPSAFRTLSQKTGSVPLSGYQLLPSEWDVKNSPAP